MRGLLLLEDGSLWKGKLFGFPGVSGGELIFNTAMTGYQEILTDPSYSGQILVMTYPMIGNYGVNGEDRESNQVWVSGFVVGQYVSSYSNWRATNSLSNYLEVSKVVGFEGVDTRALTRRLRSLGAQRAIIGPERHGVEYLTQELKKVPSMAGSNLACQVACKEGYVWKETPNPELAHIAVMDCGVKHSILRYLVRAGARVTVFPYSASAEEILSSHPDGLLVSNGPGDPEAVKGVPETLRSLFGKLPIFGICLGHQLLALALGAKTYKLKFGHHGANHPVRNEGNGRIEITSQNHGFAVDGKSLCKVNPKEFGKINITHIHLSDGTIEGFEIPALKVRAIQYHPEASPGPHDANYLFKEFLECSKPHLTT